MSSETNRILVNEKDKLDVSSSSNGVTLELWKTNTRNDLLSFGLAGRDLLNKVTDNFKFQRYRTETVKESIYKEDPANPGSMILHEQLTRP